MKSVLFIGYRDGYKKDEQMILEWASLSVLKATIKLGRMPRVIAWLRRVADDLENLYVLKLKLKGRG